MKSTGFDIKEPAISAALGNLLEAGSCAPVRGEYRRRGYVTASAERLSRRLGCEFAVDLASTFIERYSE